MEDKMLGYPNMYRVTFLTKKGEILHHVIDVEAYTSKEAKNIAYDMWHKHNDARMFFIDIRKIKDNE